MFSARTTVLTAQLSVSSRGLLASRKELRGGGLAVRRREDLSVRPLGLSFPHRGNSNASYSAALKTKCGKDARGRSQQRMERPPVDLGPQKEMMEVLTLNVREWGLCP